MACGFDSVLPRRCAPGLVIIGVALACMRALSSWFVALVTQNWKLLIVSGGGLMTYLLGTDLPAANIPTQPSTRYVAVFVLLLFAAVVSAIRLPDSRQARSLLGALALVTAVALGGRLLVWSAINVTTMSMPAPAVHLSQVANGLHAMGLPPQSRVAILGRKGDHVFWARVARMRIIDQIPDPDPFLHADPAVQMKVLAALERTGARALVCDEWSASHPGLQWQRLGASRYYALPLGGYRQSQLAR
jgi:hypothetical protein